MKKVFNEAAINVLDWPGNSPNLNPIENLWSILKSCLQKLDSTTKTKLTEAVIQVWHRDPAIIENCKRLVESMPRRVKKVLKNQGGHTSY